MKIRAGDALVLVIGLAILVGIAIARSAQAPSTYSTFDTGPNGYRALYDVLAKEGVPVQRFELRPSQLPASVRVFAITSTLPEVRSSESFTSYTSSDIARLKTFAKRGGRVLLFVSPESKFAGLFGRSAVELNVGHYSNSALEKNPRNALQAYDLVTRRGIVVFDERIHGYALDRSLWQVVPAPVHAAFWVAVLAVVLALIEANVRWVPPAPRTPPEDRDSSAYIVSMASLLRRADAPHRKESG
jgi:hypothetical protein